MPLTLTVINDAATRLGDGASRRWLERGGTVGRADNNDWTLPDPNMEISRCHARIRFEQGQYFLEDTSANGIVLGDGITRLDPAEPYPLRDGVEFLIGDYRIQASLAAEQAPPPSPISEPTPEVESDVGPDPLDLLGGAVESPEPVRQGASSRSYLDEHFAPPRYSDTPAPPDSAAPSSEPQRHAPGEGQPLLPDDWWREPPAAAPVEPEPPEPAPPAPEPLAREQPAEPPPPPPPEPAAAPRPDPGGRGQYGTGAASSRRDPQAAVAAPPGPGAGVPDDALRQLLTGAGLDPDQVPPDKAEELGRILRIAIHGVMDLLRARMEVKNAFRMSVTLIQARENNPLKFSTSPEDAIHNLMVKHNPDYLPAVEAFESGFEDLRQHQLAVLAGMRAGFFEMLRQLDPEELEARFAETDRSVLGRVTGPRHWDQYKALFKEINRDTEGYFNRLFGEAFSEAYEKKMQALKAGSAGAAR